MDHLGRRTLMLASAASQVRGPTGFLAWKAASLLQEELALTLLIRTLIQLNAVN